MDTDDIESNEQKLQSFLVAGKYREAELLCQVLWQRFGKLRCSTAVFNGLYWCGLLHRLQAGYEGGPAGMAGSAAAARLS